MQYHFNIILLLIGNFFIFADKTFATKVGADNMVVSPFTGEKIPADKIQEHIRICEYNAIGMFEYYNIFSPLSVSRSLGS